MPIKHRRLQQQAGIGLLETITTVLIVSFGLVALAAMQVQNTVYLSNSVSSLKAALYAGNYVQKLIGNTVLARSSSSPYILNSFTNTPPTAATSACIASSCSSANLAIYDVNVWLYKIKNDFPNGKARVTQQLSNNNAIYTIEIQWSYKDVTNVYQMVAQI